MTSGGYHPWPKQKPRLNLPPVGLIAGWGEFPIEVAQAIVRHGGSVCCIAIKGHASTDLESICEHVHWLGVGKIGGHIRYFRRMGAQQVTMAGKLFKANILYGGSLILRHFPDWVCLRTLAGHLLGRNRDARDDSLLLAITAAYARAGIEICPATELAPELLVNRGLLTGQPPTAPILKDMEIGWHVAKQMGGLDIGQSITIKDGVVIAVEAIEGTDACIERTGLLCRRGGWTLVKVSKPNQDMRFDVPTIGPQTIQRIQATGGKAIVIEADKTIMVQRELTIATAIAAGIAIYSIDDAGGAAVRSALRLAS